MLSIQTLFILHLVVITSSANSEDYGTKDLGVLRILTEDGCLTSTECCDAWNRTSLFNKLTMADSSMRPLRSGIMALNMYDLGRYDECLGIYQEDENIYGKYCMAKLNLGALNINEIPIFLRKGGTLRADNSESAAALYSLPPVQYAFCMPSACKAEDLQTFIILPPIAVTENDCYSNDTKQGLSTGAIITIVVLSIFGGIVTVSTIYEVILHYTHKKPHHYVLLAFSAWSNGRKIFQSSTNQDQILCLNGIKAISMMWVIIGHLYSSITSAPVDNFTDITPMLSNWKFMYLLAAPVSVDTFFAVGGMVTVYTFLKACDKGVKFNIIMFYIHRYLRLTPAFAIMALIHATLLAYLGNGPLWNMLDAILIKDCRDYWWSSLLYIQNFVKPSVNCISQTWYLQVDFQLFLLSPLVLLPLQRWTKKTLLGIQVLILAGIIIPFVITYVYDLLGLSSNTTGPKVTEDYLELYYKQTHTRFGPYVIGMQFGYFIYQIKKRSLRLRSKKRNVVLSLAWCLTISLLILCLYIGGVLIDDKTKILRSFYNALHRNGWALGVCLMVLLCASGYGGPIDAFLSHSVFQFLTKLSYSMYLVHPAVIILILLSSRTIIHFTHFYMMTTFWSHFMLTLLASFFLCITFESPIITLEKFIFGTGNSKTKKTSAKKNPPTSKETNTV